MRINELICRIPYKNITIANIKYKIIRFLSWQRRNQNRLIPFRELISDALNKFYFTYLKILININLIDYFVSLFN